MAAVLGLLRKKDAAPTPAGWNSSLNRLAERSGPWQTLSDSPAFLAAFRDIHPQGYFENARCVVMVDGFVEELDAFGKTHESAGALFAHIFQHEGLEALQHVSGQFAAVILDLSHRRVYLITDQFGSRPIFYAATRIGWCWASMTRALLPLLDSRTLDFAGVTRSLHIRWLDGEETLLREVRQVLPSRWMILEEGQAPQVHRYCRIVIESSSEAKGDLEYYADRVDEGIDHYLEKLRRRQDDLIILLSGGVDSSLLAAKAVRHGFKKLLAATPRWAGYPDPEQEQFRKVASHLKLDTLEIPVTGDRVRETLPTLVRRMEHPPRHYSSLGLQEVFSHLSGRGPVALSGIGADNLYGFGEELWVRSYRAKQDRLKSLPGFGRKLLTSILPRSGDTPLARFGQLLRHSTEDFIGQIDLADYKRPISSFVSGVDDARVPSEVIYREYAPATLSDGDRLYTLHLYGFQRAAMASYDRFDQPYGITVEMPFLLPELHTLGRSLPGGYRHEEGKSKPILRRLACRYFPRDWIYAPKNGFPAPIVDWLNGPLTEYRAMLLDDRTRERGLFNQAAIRQLTPERDYELLWSLITLEMSLRELFG